MTWDEWLPDIAYMSQVAYKFFKKEIKKQTNKQTKKKPAEGWADPRQRRLETSKFDLRVKPMFL